MHVWKSAALTAAFVIAMTGLVVNNCADVSASQGAFEWIGHGSEIGVTIKDVDNDAAKPSPNGVIVDEVRADSAAEKAGIKAGDTIVEFDGERVRSVRQFSRLVQETPAGRKVQTVLSRNGQRVTVTVAPERSSGLPAGDDFDTDRWEDGARAWVFRTPPPPPPSPGAPAPPRAPRPPAFSMPEIPDFDFEMFGRGARVGISVEDLTPQLQDYFGVKDGVLVRSVTDGSAAAKAGLKAGDVITAVNGSSVTNPSDVTHAINRLDDGQELTFEIVRDKKTLTLKGKLEPRQDRVRRRSIV